MKTSHDTDPVAVEKMPNPPLRYAWSIEQLVHFSCPTCGGWWTMGDALIDLCYFCPHCGRNLAPGEDAR